MQKLILFISIASLFFSGCSEKDIETPDFDVSVTKNTFKVNDSVTFNFTGNPDNITFYSGEAGSKYEKRFQFTSDNGTLLLDFVSQTKAGATLPQNLSVLVSTDFSGKYHSASVKSANWTNITNRVKLATTNSDVSSGIINLDDLKVKGKPMFIAFRYLSENPTTTAQRYWNIGRMNFINRVVDNDDFALTSTIEKGLFKIVDLEGSINKWQINTGTATSHRLIHIENAINSPHDDDWIISRPFYVFETVGHVKNSINVKSISADAPTGFTYKYSTPGTYKATFVAMNANRDTQKEVVKEVSITIEP